jgi:DNA adenine methylase
MDEYQERLKDVKIYNKSYEVMLKKFDSPSTFFYLDPPYEDSEKLYTEGVIDYEEMRSLLDKVKGKWLLTINDSPEIRRIFKGYYYKSIKEPTRGGRGETIGKKPRKELIITNYKNN